MSWPIFKLGKLFRITSGGTPSRKHPEYYQNGDIHWIKTGDLHQRYIESASEFITDTALNSSSTKLYPPNTVLLAMYGATIGACSILKIEACTNQACAAFTPNEKVFPLFLYYFLKSKKSDFVNAGTGGAQPNISGKYLKDYEIPLPPLPIQKQIAAALEKADALRQQCQQMEKELNALAQSVFLEMFGDPVTNSKKWPTAKFAALGELNRGKSKHRPRNDPKLLGGIYPLIQTGDVARADNYITEYKHTYSEFGLKQSRLWKKGTLCITIAANIADTAILGFDACFPDSVVGFNANKNITSNMFVHYWLNFYQIILERTAPESAQKNINLKILEALEIFVPPINKQNEFVDILNQIESQKSVCREAIVNSETNFNSLMQRAFKGELDLKASA